MVLNTSASDFLERLVSKMYRVDIELCSLTDWLYLSATIITSYVTSVPMKN